MPSVASGAPDPGSFRDPSGFVFERDGRLLRQVNRSFADRWDALVASRLLERLQSNGLLVRHAPAPVELALHPDTAHAVIEPERVPFISYPYEWSFGQLKDAALLTLEAQTVAAAAGYTLRDASAYNVQFVAGAPILIDTLSFEPATEGRPWVAYRQFCEHFLAPLALMAHRDVRCGLMLREFIDGIPVDLAATLLPGRTKLNVGLASHIHAHGRAQRRAASGSTTPTRTARVGGLQQAALLDSLRRTVQGLEWKPTGTAWADYADNTSYADAAAASKDALVRSMVEAAGGQTVWDMGANTGRFSSIAASLGRNVIAWDLDQGATEQHYREIRRAGQKAILPLLLDLANPSPGLGWAHRERRAFLDRASADAVLALALVHHLVIGRNIPVEMVAELFAAIAPQLIVEFIPESDPMVAELKSGRTDRFPYPDIEAFRTAFGTHFEVVDEQQIQGSGRRLLRMNRRSDH
jgi:hypothetical protein